MFDMAVNQLTFRRKPTPDNADGIANYGRERLDPECSIEGKLKAGLSSTPSVV
jgi:hypothetical protein